MASENCYLSSFPGFTLQPITSAYGHFGRFETLASARKYIILTSGFEKKLSANRTLKRNESVKRTRFINDLPAKITRVVYRIISVISDG